MCFPPALKIPPAPLFQRGGKSPPLVKGDLGGFESSRSSLWFQKYHRFYDHSLYQVPVRSDPQATPIIKFGHEKARNMPESEGQQECGFAGGLPEYVKV
jgi:hypothetical protein